MQVKKKVKILYNIFLNKSLDEKITDLFLIYVKVFKSRSSKSVLRD